MKMNRWIMLLFSLALITATVAQAQDLEELLEQVGEEYAKGYVSPFIEAFGPNQNSALYQDANIPWGGLTFGVGLKVMATHLNEDDQTFQKVVEDIDLSDIDPSLSGTATAVFAGPTVFGDTGTNGTITLVPDGGGPPVSLEGIPGLVETRFVPMFAPEAHIGGIFGLRGVVRFFPEMNLGDYGKTKYMGYGLQWSPNGLLPTFPLGLMVGYFNQELNVGSLIEANAKSMFIAASKGFGGITVFGGYALEESDMTVTYTYLETGEDISFDADAAQDNRLTLGVKFGPISVEMAHGQVTNYSAGAMFGF